MRAASPLLVLTLLVPAAGCNALFGLDETTTGEGDGGGDDDDDDDDDDSADGGGGRDSGPDVDARAGCPSSGGEEVPDEDGDGVGDTCDNCPHVANPAQADLGELDLGGQADGVGDACDPNPTSPGDVLVLFDPFNENLGFWTGYLGEWAVDGGNLVQPFTVDSTSLIFYNGDPSLVDVTVDTGIEVVATANGSEGAEVGPFARLGFQDDEIIYGYHCKHNNAAAIGGTAIEPYRWVPGALQPFGAGNVIGVPAVSAGSDLAYRITAHTAPRVDVVDCGLVGGATVSAANDTNYPSGAIGVRTRAASVAVHYVAVYQRNP